MDVINRNGKMIDFESSMQFMDIDIREQLHLDLVIDKDTECTEQEFFTAYEQAHQQVHGEEWHLSSKNPTW